MGDLRKLEVDVLKLPCFRYPYFIMRVMLAALDHNFYLFRKAKAMVDDGQRGHRKYSKRSQKYHAELVKEEKTYRYAADAYSNGGKFQPAIRS